MLPFQLVIGISRMRRRNLEQGHSVNPTWKIYQSLSFLLFCACGHHVKKWRAQRQWLKMAQKIQLYTKVHLSILNEALLSTDP